MVKIWVLKCLSYSFTKDAESRRSKLRPLSHLVSVPLKPKASGSMATKSSSGFPFPVQTIFYCGYGLIDCEQDFPCSI